MLATKLLSLERASSLEGMQSIDFVAKLMASVPLDAVPGDLRRRLSHELRGPFFGA